MEDRIKGQETELRISENGNHLDSINSVKSFEITFGLQLKSEGYIGETTDRKDNVFNGVRGRASIHLTAGAVFDMFDNAVKAARRSPGFVSNRISATSILRFPNGDERVIFIPNIKFDEIPMNVGGRTDYVEVNLNWEASEYDLR